MNEGTGEERRKESGARILSNLAKVAKLLVVASRFIRSDDFLRNVSWTLRKAESTTWVFGAKKNRRRNIMPRAQARGCDG